MKSRASTILITTAVSFSLLAIGCGGGGGDSAPAADTAGGETAAQQGPMGTASISGTINFTGTAPEPVRLNVDRECADLNNGDPVYSEAVVVNDGTLQWAFVYVSEGVTGEYSPPAEAVVIDQDGCKYAPHVLGVQTNQTIRVVNSDPLLHNIHAMPEANRSFNFGMPNVGEREQRFPLEEVMVPIKCDVHPWMGAYAGVVSHPFYDVSGADGSFSITGLPAGTYTVTMWHETYGAQSMEVTVGDGESVTTDFTVDAASAMSATS